MNFSRIDHVALDVADLERSVDFYTRQFGFRRYYDQTTPAGLKISYLELGPTVLELVGRKPEKGMAGFHFCLITDDFEGAVAKLRGEGIPFVTPPHPTDARKPEETGWRRVVFQGLDGEHIEIRG
ncbi:MAG: VOC family protein [Hyphomicrobiaceae bacterium]